MVFQLLRLSADNFRMEDRQVNGEVGVFVGHVHKGRSHLQGHSQFLPALPDEGFLFGLPFLHLAAHKLPEKTSGFMGRTLTG